MVNPFRPSIFKVIKFDKYYELARLQIPKSSTFVSEISSKTKLIEESTWQIY